MKAQRGGGVSTERPADCTVLSRMDCVAGAGSPGAVSLSPGMLMTAGEENGTFVGTIFPANILVKTTFLDISTNERRKCLNCIRYSRIYKALDL